MNQAEYVCAGQGRKWIGTYGLQNLKLRTGQLCKLCTRIFDALFYGIMWKYPSTSAVTYINIDNIGSQDPSYITDNLEKIWGALTYFQS